LTEKINHTFLYNSSGEIKITFSYRTTGKNKDFWYKPTKPKKFLRKVIFCDGEGEHILKGNEETEEVFHNGSGVVKFFDIVIQKDIDDHAKLSKEEARELWELLVDNGFKP
jgi:hypothetical protein